MKDLTKNNVLLENIVDQWIFRKTTSGIDQVIPDFDRVLYHVSTPESKTKMLVSIKIDCFESLMKYDLQSVLERYYHGFIVSPEEKYNFSLYIDLEKIAEDEKEKKDLVRSIGLLKRNILSAPFEKAFCLQQLLEEQKNEQDTKNTHKEIIKIPYRDEEAIFIIPSSDRVTVIFSMIFKEETDIILGKEFVDARKRPAIQNAPQVFYSYRDPPLEIQTLCDLKSSDNIGYVTFVLFPQHYTPQKKEDCIAKIQLFRNMLYYHIKASKVHMHERMRARVAQFLKVLNRAKLENTEKAKKTASGRSFNVSK